MRWFALAAAAGAAFLVGRALAAGPDAPAAKEVVAELRRRQKLLAGDVDRVERAARDIVEIRKMVATGKYVLNEEERKMQKRGRVDFHIFLERIRNDTLQVLEIYDRVLHKQDYVEPLERVFGRALHELVEVRWEDQPVEEVVADLSEGYGVRINVGGSIDYRKTLSLEGQMSLLSILLHLETLLDARLEVREGHQLWIVRAGGGGEPGDDPGDDG